MGSDSLPLRDQRPPCPVSPAVRGPPPAVPPTTPHNEAAMVTFEFFFFYLVRKALALLKHPGPGSFLTRRPSGEAEGGGPIWEGEASGRSGARGPCKRAGLRRARRRVGDGGMGARSGERAGRHS